MDVHEDTFGRSDHVTFRNLGAQTIFHLGAYDEDYSAYHSPSDTFDNMIAEVGGPEELKIPFNSYCGRHFWNLS